MKRVIYLLNIDRYAPQITELTYPRIRRYAKKIGAEIEEITFRAWPQYPPVYEKLQIHARAKANGADWHIYIDSDTLVHPDLFDVTEHLPKDTVLHNGCDMAGNRWRYDHYFRRDGRHIGSCNWCTIASDWCLDLWAQPDISYEECLENIWPSQGELNSVITREHLIDDYILSRNIARYGLKFTTLQEIQKRLNDGGNYLWHQYTMTTEQKVIEMNRILKEWGI